MRSPGKHRQLVVYALLALSIFVFLHSFIPSDPRVRMGFKKFLIEWEVGPEEAWFAIKKWRHLVWFAIFFPLVRSLFRERATVKAVAAILGVSILIELQQTVIAGRNARLADLLPNFIGALFGALVVEVFLFIRRRLARP